MGENPNNDMSIHALFEEWQRLLDYPLSRLGEPDRSQHRERIFKAEDAYRAAVDASIDDAKKRHEEENDKVAEDDPSPWGDWGGWKNWEYLPDEIDY